MRKVVHLHDGLRALHPRAIVFAGVGTRPLARELGRVRALLGMPTLRLDRSPLSIAVSREGLAIWAQSPVITLRPAQLAVVAVDEGVMDVTAIVKGATASFTVPLAVPAESSQIADRVLVALAGAHA